jgi:cysteine-rich repeat protein
MVQLHRIRLPQTSPRRREAHRWVCFGFTALLAASTGCITKGNTNIGAVQACGDGALHRSEDCDDGNEDDGDGCSQSCEVESGWACSRPGRACTELTQQQAGDSGSSDDADDTPSQDEATDSQDEQSPSPADDEPQVEEDTSDEEADPEEDDTSTATSDETTTEEGDVVTDDSTETTSEPSEDACVPGEGHGVLGEPWVRQFGTSEHDSATAVALDSCGNVSLVGTSQGILPEQSVTSAGPTAFVRKYDSNGGALWTRQFAKEDWTQGLAVGVDASGNVLVGGDTKGALGDEPSAGSVDAFVRKYDAAGREEWTRQFGSDDWDSVSELAVTAGGDVIVVGYTNGVLPDKVGDGIYKDAFVRKYAANGAAVWTTQFGTDDEDWPTSVAVDGSGKVFVAGYTWGALTADANSGSSDLFVQALDADGKGLWSTQLGSIEDDVATDIRLDGDGNVYVAGYTYDALPGALNQGDYDAFVVKYTTTGAWGWTRQFGGTHSDSAIAMDINAAGDLIVVGETDGTFSGSTSAGAADIFVRGFRANGEELWTGQFGAEGDDQPLAFALDGEGKFVLAGRTTSTLAGAPLAGETDAFLQILDP